MSENKKDQNRLQPVIPLVEIVAGDRPQYENTGGLRYSAYFIKLTKDPAAIETTLNYYRELERVRILNYYNSQCFNPFHYEELIFEFEFDCCEDRDQNEEVIEIGTTSASNQFNCFGIYGNEQCDQIVHQWQVGFHSDLFTQNLDQLYFFEYKNEKERLAANIKEFPGGSGEVLQEKFEPPTNILSNPGQGLVIGCEVLHSVFGKGVLKGHDKSEVTRDSSGRITDFSKMKLEVDFPIGTKRILAKYCKLVLDDGRVVKF